LIPINEIFPTIQGEGSNSGTPAVFIRTQGCDVGCGWCDTKHTWELDEGFQSITFGKMMEHERNWKPMSVEEIVARVRQQAGNGIDLVVISGGEPLIHDLEELVNTLFVNDFIIQIETSGTREISEYLQDCFVTCSPKFNMPGGLPVLKQALLMSNEIKLPVGKIRDIHTFTDFVDDEKINPADLPPVFLQPLSQSPKATQLCVAESMKRGWLLSIQTHKYINIA
jgi:7-carboxy-7-deazaguanine synthase